MEHQGQLRIPLNNTTRPFDDLLKMSGYPKKEKDYFY